MYNIKRQISVFLQRALLVGFIGIAFQLLSCMPEFDNPVSFNYQGDYKLTQNNTFPDSTSLEILKIYEISFKSSGTDKYWKIYVSSPSSHLLSDTVRGDTLHDNKGSTLFLFNSPCTTSIDLIGLRPNRICDTVHLYKNTSQVNKKRFYVYNPYYIDGKKTSEVDDSVTLKIMRRDTAQIPNYIQSINWLILTAFKSSEDQGESLHVSNSQRGIVTLNATLKVIFCSTTYAYIVDTFKVDFPGTAPKVDSFKVVDTLRLGVPATFSFKCVDPDPDPLRYIISADLDTLLDTIVEHTSGHNAFNIKPIADTSYSIIRLKVIDSTGFEARDSIKDPTIYFEHPEITFGNYDTVPMNDSIYILCSGKADFYHWRYRNSSVLRTLSNNITLPPYKDTLYDTIYVYGENIFYFKNDTIRVTGKSDSIILKPTYSEYTVTQSNVLPFIKTKQWDSIVVFTKHNDTIIPDSTLRFEWSVNGSSASLVEFKTFGPKINFFLTDTLPYFSVSVKIYDSTHLLTNWNKTIPIRVFSPTFAFQNDTIKDSVLTHNLLYSASDDTSCPGGKVDSIYLKQIGGPSGDTSTQKFTSQQETTLTFNSSGTYKIVGWAIDNESNASPKDTIILNITTHKPEFDSTNVSKTLSLGDTAKLKAQLKSDSNILKYYWDTNNDGKWDDSTTSKEKDTIFPKDTNYIIQAQCRNSFGDTAIARMFFHVNIKKNAPIISLFKIDTATHYVKKPLNFLISGSDPDSSLTKVYLCMIDSFKALSVVDSSATFTSASVNNDIAYQPLFSGRISFFTILKDKHNNSTSSETLSIVIDSGVPKITTFKVDSIHYVNDKILFTISGNDPDSGLKSVQLYRFTTTIDSTLIDSAQFQGNTRTFDNLTLIDSLRTSPAYTYSYFVLLKDSNNFIAKSKTRQVVVDSGLPVIDNITIGSNTSFINDSVTITITAHDNDSIKKVLLFSQNDLLLDSIISSSKKTTFIKKITFKNGGTFQIKARAFDNNGFLSNYILSKDSIVIKQGIPTIINATKLRAFAKHSTDITINANDNDSAVLTYSISYGDTNIFSAFTTGKVFTLTFADSGNKVFYVRVKDIDGQLSTIYTDTIHVDHGAPTIKSVTSDSVIYINDFRKFTISAKDSNGYINKIYAYFNNDTIANDSIVNSNLDRDTFSFTHKFASTDTGSRTIHFKVFDNDSFLSLIDKSIIVHKGSPVLQRWFSDSVNYWANDSIPFHFQCYDTNGTIKNIIINWGDGYNTDTTINIKTNYTFIKKHIYVIANDTTYHVSIQITDDDAMKSTFTDTIRVLRGMPRVWLPGGGDTLFSRIANNGGDYNLSVSSSDPNDYIVRYYWILGGTSFDIDHKTYDTTVTLLILSGNQDQVNKSYRAAVLAKDMDGNIAGDTFYIYLDGPPPAPTIVYPISSNTIYSDQSVVFEWYGTDVHDSINTRYRISILPPVSNPTEKEILKFTDNSSVTKELVNGIFHFKFQYNPTEGFGAYSWKVEAQDISNSTASSPQQPFSFVQR